MGVIMDQIGPCHSPAGLEGEANSHSSHLTPPEQMRGETRSEVRDVNGRLVEDRTIIFYEVPTSPTASGSPATTPSAPATENGTGSNTPSAQVPLWNVAPYSAILVTPAPPPSPTDLLPVLPSPTPESISPPADSDEEQTESDDATSPTRGSGSRRPFEFRRRGSRPGEEDTVTLITNDPRKSEDHMTRRGYTVIEREPWRGRELVKMVSPDGKDFIWHFPRDYPDDSAASEGGPGETDDEAEMTSESDEDGVVVYEERANNDVNIIRYYEDGHIEQEVDPQYLSPGSDRLIIYYVPDPSGQGWTVYAPSAPWGRRMDDDPEFE